MTGLVYIFGFVALCIKYLILSGDASGEENVERLTMLTITGAMCDGVVAWFTTASWASFQGII